MLIRGLGYPAILAVVATIFTLALYFLPTLAKGRPLLAGASAAVLTGFVSTLFCVGAVLIDNKSHWFVGLLFAPMVFAESAAIALAVGLIIGSALAVFGREGLS